jgi:hypothetical protein
MVEGGTPAWCAASMMAWIPFIESGRMVAGFFIRAVIPLLTRQTRNV